MNVYMNFLFIFSAVPIIIIPLSFRVLHLVFFPILLEMIYKALFDTIQFP